MSVEVGKIHLSLLVDTEQAKKTLSVFAYDANRAARGVMGSFAGIGTTLAAAFSIRAITRFSKECIGLGSDIQEVQNVVDVAFGDMSHKMEAFAATSIETYGISKLAAKQTGSTYMAMAKGMGVAQEAAADMSLALTGLSADMASFYNKDQEETKTALAAVFTGETEALKKYGVVMTDVNLQEFARQKGITKTIAKMNQQEKVMLRYQYVLEATSLAAGDFARTQDGWANQTRILSERFSQVKATLGQGFINVLLPVVHVLNDLLAKLQLVADAFVDLTVKVFGNAGGSSSGGNAINSAATASNEIAKNTSAAAGSAKAYAKALAGFDKLNVLSSPSGGGGGGGSDSDYSSSLFPTGSGLLGGAGSGYDTSAMQNKLVEIAGIVGVASLALGAILTFTGANIPLGIALMAIGAASLATAIVINAKAINDSVATGLDLVMATVSGAALALGAILAVSGVNMKLGIALMAIGAAGLAATAALNWNAVTNEVKTAITGIASAVGAGLLAAGAIMALSGVNIPLGIGLMVAGAASLGSAIALNWNAVSEGVGSTVSTITAIVGGALLGLGAVLAFTGVALPLGLGLMAAGAVSLASAIAPNWTGISDKTRNTISVISGIAGAAMLALGVILLLTGAGIPLGLGLIAAGGVSLASAIAPNWDAITGKIREICGTIGEIFSGLWEGIKNGFRFAINGLIGFANKWINDLNALLIPVRALIVGIAKAFGNDISLGDVRIPNIPKLANGGYVKANTPQLAMIGDNRHQGEIVAPEGKITEAVAAALGPIVEAMKALGASIKTMQSGTGQIVVKCVLDGKVIYETVVKQNNSVVRMTGKSPLRV